MSIAIVIKGKATDITKRTSNKRFFYFFPTSSLFLSIICRMYAYINIKGKLLPSNIQFTFSPSANTIICVMD